MIKVIFINLLLLIAGCASIQTEIIGDPGRVDSLTVGMFVTADPVDNELIGDYLRKELSKRGFQIIDDSPNLLTGTIDVKIVWDIVTYKIISDARIVLNKNSSEQVIWQFKGYLRREEFVRYIANRITKKLK